MTINRDNSQLSSKDKLVKAMREAISNLDGKEGDQIAPELERLTVLHFISLVESEVDYRKSVANIRKDNKRISNMAPTEEERLSLLSDARKAISELYKIQGPLKAYRTDRKYINLKYRENRTKNKTKYSYLKERLEIAMELAKELGLIVDNS